MGILIRVNGENITSRIPNIDTVRASEIMKKWKNAVFIDKVNDFEFPTDGKNYNVVYRNGEIVYEEIIEPEYEPTETELIQAELLLNQADIIAKQNEHDEVLAEILLNQMEV